MVSHVLSKTAGDMILLVSAGMAPSEVIEARVRQVWKPIKLRVICWDATGKQDHKAHRDFKVNEKRQAKAYAKAFIADGGGMVDVDLVKENPNYPLGNKQRIKTDTLARYGPLASR